MFNYMQGKYWVCLLLLWCSLFGRLLCHLLGRSFLGRGFFSWGLLLGSSLLLGWSLSLGLGRGLGLLSLRFFGLGGLGFGFLSGQFEGSSSLLTGSSGGHDSLGGDELLEGDPDTATSLGSVHLVVGTDVLEDGLAGGALLVSEGLDGGLDHGGVRRVGSRGLGSSSSSHGDVVLCCRCGESPH